MAATPYRPVAFNDKSLTKEKLEQTSNNIQWLFENSPKMRYNYANGALVRDNGLKIIAGKTWFGAVPGRDWADSWIYFGNFFSAACKPIVTATIETTGWRLRKFVTIRSVSGAAEVDHRGFICHISDHETVVTPTIEAGGWVHWQAVGF